MGFEGDKGRGREVGAVGAKDSAACECSSGEREELVSDGRRGREGDEAHCSRTAFNGCFLGGELSRMVT